jgi:hypothetical protein
MEATVAEKHDGFIYEPENIKPDNLPPLPVGTLDELKKEGLDPTAVGCCHKSVKDGEGNHVIRGCPFRVNDGDGVMEICQLEERDVAGPRNYGLKITKGKVHGGAVLRREAPCFYIAQFKRQIEANGGMVQIVAWEKGVAKGRPTTYSTVEVRKGEGLDTTYAARPVLNREVTPFVRPGENPELANEILKGLERAEAEKERLLRRGEGFSS